MVNVQEHKLRHLQLPDQYFNASSIPLCNLLCCIVLYKFALDITLNSLYYPLQGEKYCDYKLYNISEIS